MKICNVKTTRSRKSVGGIFGNLDSLKNMRSRNCGGGGGKGDLEKSRFDWVFLNDGAPKIEFKI